MLLTLAILSAVALALVAAGYLLRSRQALASLQVQVQRAWDEVDELLLQRHDAIGRLQTESMSSDAHTGAMMHRLRQADSALHAARARRDVTAVGIAEEHLRNALASRRAPPSVDETMTSLTDIRALTDQVAVRRDAYNEAVNLYNIRLQAWPEAAIGRAAGLGPVPLLEYPGS